MAGQHGTANKPARRFELVRKRLRVEQRKKAGTLQAHRTRIARVTGPMRTGKAARKAEKKAKRAGREVLVRNTTPQGCVQEADAAYRWLRALRTRPCSRRRRWRSRRKDEEEPE
jgi:hypothetical protein